MKTLSLRALCFAATAITLSTLVHGQPRPPAARDASMSRLDDTLLEKLDGTTVDAEYVAVDFEDVVDDLRERYELNIHVSWDNLDAVGVRKDKRLEVRLRQVSLATLLDMILREAEPRPAELGYTVEGGVVVISRRGALARNTFIRTYEITDLIESGYALRRFGNTPVLSLQLTGREFLGGEARESGGLGGVGVGGGVGGGAIYGDPAEDPSRLSKMERAQQIIDVVTESIDPGSWGVNGGDVATIRVFNGVLIIRNTIDGHRRVGDFLDLLRHSMPPPLDGEAIVLSVPRQLDDAGRPAEYEDWLIVHVSQPQARGPAMASVATVNQKRTDKTLARGDLPR